MKFIKKLSGQVSLVGQYIQVSGAPALWNIRLVSTSPVGPQARVEYSEGDLPSRDTASLGGFIATNYVDLNLHRHYQVEDASGTEVFRDSLT